MDNEIINIARDSPAARNRYIYYPDHLVRLPGPGISWWQRLNTLRSEPLFSGLASSIFKECFIKRGRFPQEADMSIGAFITRHFGSSMADNLFSAVCHGIYAGDIYKLSMRSLFPKPWITAERYGSIALGAGEAFLGSALPVSEEDIDFIAMRMIETSHNSSTSEKARLSSVFTFKKGLISISDSLIKNLQDHRPNVKLAVNTKVSEVERSGLNDDSKVGIYKITSSS